MKIDLHVHSKYSHDCLTEPIDIIKKAKKQGLNGFVITEHNSYEVSSPWDNLKRDDGLIILRGVEYKTKEGHVLIYGIDSDQYIPDKRIPISNIIKLAKEHDWALVAPHPFNRLGDGEDSLGDVLYDVYDYFDAIEINSKCDDDENDRATSFANEFNIPLVGGSDAHFVLW